MWRKPTEEKLPSPDQGKDTHVPVATSVKSEEKSEIPTPVASTVPSPVPTPAPVIAPVAAQPPPPPAAPQPKVARETSRITSGLKINGEVSGDTDLYIDGEMQGSIRLPAARVAVGPQGNVKADIDAREIVIEGAVQGTLKAAENIHLGASSRVQGSILAPRIGIDDGARLRGQVDMSRTASGSDFKESSSASDSKIARSASVGVKV